MGKSCSPGFSHLQCLVLLFLFHLILGLDMDINCMDINCIGS